jgi:hypothetical protein
VSRPTVDIWITRFEAEHFAGLMGDVAEVLVCYALGVYETQSNPQANRVIV